MRYDWLEVRDGDNEKAPLIGSRMCGTSSSNEMISSGNQLFIKFHSDYSVTRTGYRIRVDLGNISYVMLNLILVFYRLNKRLILTLISQYLFDLSDDTSLPPGPIPPSEGKFIITNVTTEIVNYFCFLKINYNIHRGVVGPRLSANFWY